MPLSEEYTRENLELLEKGCENLVAHINTIRRSGVRHGALAAVSDHWLRGGEGAKELAEAVVAACQEENDFRFLYEPSWPLRKQIETIAGEIYGADGVSYSPEAAEKAQALESLNGGLTGFGICMVKTHLSLSHDPNLKGRPRNWTLPIRDFRHIDVDVETGKVRGLF